LQYYLHHLEENSCKVKLPWPIINIKGKTVMVEEPSHEIQRSLNHLRNKGLILNNGVAWLSYDSAWLSHGAPWLSYGAAWLSYGAAWLSYGAAWLSW
jgi:hypothetical protein